MKTKALRLAAVVVAISGVLAVPAGRATAQTDREPVERVLVLSLPGLSWEDVDLATLPNLRELFEESALADMSVRGVERHPSLGDGYVTIGAGARAVTRRVGGGDCFEADERFEQGSAGDAFARRTGVPATSIPADAIVCLAQSAIGALNDGLLFDAHAGLLGDTLASNRVQRAVIGNADEGDPPSGARERSAALALAGSDGQVPRGAVSGDLVVPDATFPFGVRSDDAEVLSQFDQAWHDRAVVLVEASDLARFEEYRTDLAPGAREVMHQHVLASVDALVGELLERVDPEHDAVLAVAPSQRNERGRPLTVAALRAPGFDPGLLKSAYTRHSGIVSIIDVGPTIVDLFGIERPEDMEGRAFEYSRQGGDFDDRLAWLVETDEEAQFRDRLVAPVSGVFVALQIVLTLAAIVALVWLGRRSRVAVEIFALALLGFLPATYLAGLLPFSSWGTAAFWAFLLGVGLIIGLVAWLVTDRTGVTTLIVSLGAIVGLIVADVATGARLQFNTVFGYTPTVAGRFAGLGNIGYAQLAAGAVLLAGFIAFRVTGRRGTLLAITVMLIAVIVDGAPFFGADVGGVLSMVPAFLVTSTLLLGWRFRWRLLAIYGSVGVLVLGLFALFEVSRPSEERTHLGRLIESGSGDGGGGRVATVLARKIDANTSVLFRSVWTIMLPVVLAGIAYLIWRAPGHMRGLYHRVPTLSASLIGFAILAILGFALNDSGIAVPGVMLGVLTPVLVVLTLRAERERAPSSAFDDELAELQRADART
jgi:hypothetical protein